MKDEKNAKKCNGYICRWRLSRCVNKELHFNISIFEIKLDLWINVNTDSIMRTEYCGEQQLWKEENDCVLTYLICINRIKNKGAYKYKYKYIVTKIARICVGSYEVGQGEIELQSVLSLLLYFVLNISIYWVPKGSKRV